MAQFARGPQSRGAQLPANAPHAALLIDFDNVTMGIRSDLTKELKNLLNSDIIKGKVAVQRAYADWRRYPQYIVPLAENSVDLIFAPAYGSSKKNATDIRLAIDALELVFTRPEIGAFILLSGDSDFSSLVLKLKEYGKYVIGVGIRESSSDLLVQNCDEYYSYSALTGLTRAGEETATESFDPWELVEISVRQMVDQNDVMRSDRLKQIMIELDPNFDEKAIGFAKFNRFLQEAAGRGLIALKKMENGQFEVGPVEPGAAPVQMPTPPTSEVMDERSPRRERGGRGRGRGRDREREPRAIEEPAMEAPAIEAPAPTLVPELAAAAPTQPEPPAQPEAPSPTPSPSPSPFTGEIKEAYQLLHRAMSDLSRNRSGIVRDSDVKRRMLELRNDFDEGRYGFSKFSRFLRQAHDAEVINVNRVENGGYEVTLGAQANAFRGGAFDAPAAASAAQAPRAVAAVAEPKREERGRDGDRERERGGRGRGRGRDRERGGRDRERGKEHGTDRERSLLREEMERQRAFAQRQLAAGDEGYEEARAAEAAAADAEREPPIEPKPAAPKEEQVPAVAASAPAPAATPAPAKAPTPSTQQPAAVSVAFRRGSSRRGAAPSGPPPILPGQTVQLGGKQAPTVNGAEPRFEEPAAAASSQPEASAAPVDQEAVVDRLAGYKGVGRKTAEAVVQAFGPEQVFSIMQDQPDRLRQTLGARRAELLLKGWQLDSAKREKGAKKRPARKAPVKAAAKAAAKTAVKKGPQIEAFTEAGANARKGAKTARGGRKKTKA